MGRAAASSKRSELGTPRRGRTPGAVLSARNAGAITATDGRVRSGRCGQEFDPHALTELALRRALAAL